MNLLMIMAGNYIKIKYIINQKYSSKEYYSIFLKIRLKLIPLKVSLSGFLDQ